NGCGIANDKIAKIFNPFYTSKTNGTGLGLGVAKKVIDAHRGTIEVQSKVGNGTEFVLAIPLSDAVRDSADASIESSTDPAGETAAEPAPGNNGRSPAPEPIVPLAAGAPSTESAGARDCKADYWWLTTSAGLSSRSRGSSPRRATRSRRRSRARKRSTRSRPACST